MHENFLLLKPLFHYPSEFIIFCKKKWWYLPSLLPNEFLHPSHVQLVEHPTPAWKEHVNIIQNLVVKASGLWLTRYLIAFTIFLRAAWFFAIATASMSCWSGSHMIITLEARNLMISNQFCGKCKWVTSLNLLASRLDYILVNGFIKTALTWTSLQAVTPRSEALAISADRQCFHVNAKHASNESEFSASNRTTPIL